MVNEEQFPAAFTEMPKLKTIIEICIEQKIDANLVCNGVPTGVTCNAVYVIDLRSIAIEDLSADHFIYDEHASPKDNIIVEMKEGKVTSFKRNAASTTIQRDLSTNQILNLVYKKQYSYIRKGNFSQTRFIVKFEKEDGSWARYAIVSYKATAPSDVSGTDLGKQMLMRPHKNKKGARENYYRTKPSVLSKVKQYGQFMRPKQIIAETEKDAGGVIEALSPCDISRNRMQVCNKLRQVQNRPKARNTGRNRTPDYGKLVSLAQAGDFVRDFSIHRNQKKDATVPRVFAAAECNIGWIKKFCNPLSKAAVPAGVDMPYKCGPFYVTTLTIQHPLFVSRDRHSQHPGILLAIMTSGTREKSDYEYMASQLLSSGEKA